jgi:hypothetical protein
VRSLARGSWFAVPAAGLVLLACTTFSTDESVVPAPDAEAGASSGANGDAGGADGGADGGDDRPFGKPTVLAAGEKSPRAIVLDAEALYWQTEGDAPASGEIVRLDRGGGGLRRMLHGGVDTGNLLTADGAALYWGQSEGGAGNGRVGTLKKDGTAFRVYAPTQYAYQGLAVDALHLYAVDALGALYSSPKETGLDPLALRPNDADARAITQGGDFILLRTGSTIVRVSKSGAGIIDFAKGTVPVTAMVADATRLYWVTEMDGRVRALELTKPGVAPAELARDQKNPSAVAVSGGFVYWANRGDGSIMRAPVVGGTAQAVALAQPDPVGIAADEHGVFWTNAGDGTVVGVTR